jgi:hypothetical protein
MRRLLTSGRSMVVHCYWDTLHNYIEREEINRSIYNLYCKWYSIDIISVGYQNEEVGCKSKINIRKAVLGWKCDIIVIEREWAFLRITSVMCPVIPAFLRILRLCAL